MRTLELAKIYLMVFCIVAPLASLFLGIVMIFMGSSIERYTQLISMSLGCMACLMVFIILCSVIQQVIQKIYANWKNAVVASWLWSRGINPNEIENWKEQMFETELRKMGIDPNKLGCNRMGKGK